MSSPQHHETDVALRDDSTVHVRPVRAEDGPAVRAFFERLSPKSIGLRFFCGVPDLDRAVRWATEVDQHRYGLIATGTDGRVVAHAGWEREPDHPSAPRSWTKPDPEAGWLGLVRSPTPFGGPVLPEQGSDQPVPMTPPRVALLAAAGDETLEAHITDWGEMLTRFRAAASSSGLAAAP